MNNNMKNTFKKVRKNIVEYIITNRLFISYVILSLIATICVRKFTIGSAFKFKPLVTDLGFILLIGSLGYFIKPKNQFKYYFTWLIIFNLMCLISSIYYRFFTSFASIGELATMGQTETVKGSILDKLRLSYGIYIIIPIIFYLIHKKLLSSSYYYFIDKIEKSKKMFTSTLVISLVFISYTFGVATNADYSRIKLTKETIHICDIVYPSYSDDEEKEIILGEIIHKIEEIASVNNQNIDFEIPFDDDLALTFASVNGFVNLSEDKRIFQTMLLTKIVKEREKDECTLSRKQGKKSN